MKGINLEKVLLEQREKTEKKNDFLAEIRAILDQNENERDAIKTRLQKEASTNVNKLQFDLLETQNIYHLRHIEKICVDYRLRFLESGLFKDQIPEEAISKIRSLEKQHQTQLEGFKIVAPSKSFHLKNYDDPLLFVPLGNDYYYLIHKWGNDLNPLRKLTVLPFKNLWNFVVFCVAVSALLTWCTPETELSRNMPMASLIIFLFIFKGIIAVAAYYFFMLGKNFNTEIWQRKYYNN